MTIWILAVLVFAFLAWMGYLKGAIRVTVMLVGLIVAAILALPLAHWVKPLFPMMGVVNPYLLWILPPITVFILVQLIFAGIAFLVHRQVALYYKYKTDDVHRIRWERLNNRLGICVGLGAGCVYLVLFGLLIYIGGYLTVQVTAEENVPTTLALLNTARTDLQTTGLDKMVAKFDPTPASFYEASDVVGLVYRNPLLQGRLSGYPALLPMEERTEFQELAGDKDFIELFQRQEPITKVLNHPRVQALAKNSDIVQEIARLDLKDLRQYLETGISPKYEEEKILGRWRLDLNATLADLKKVLTTLPASSWKNVKKALTMSGMSLTAMPDNKVVVKVQEKESILKLTQASPPTQPAAASRPGTAPTARSLAARADPNAQDPRMLQRYGGRTPSAQPVPPPVLVLPAQASQTPSPILKLIFSGDGTWKNEGEKYKVVVNDTKPQNLVATVRADTLILAKDDLRLVFEKE
jgi:hypothetical protein